MTLGWDSNQCLAQPSSEKHLLAIDGDYQRPTAAQVERETLKHSALTWDINFSTQDSGIDVEEKAGRLWEPEVVNSKETLSFRHNRAGKNTKSQQEDNKTCTN